MMHLSLLSRTCSLILLALWCDCGDGVLNWCFSAVFEATKPAYRAMADISVSESVYRVECVFFFFFFKRVFFCVGLERVLKRDGEKGQSSTHPKKASSSVLREREFDEKSE